VQDQCKHVAVSEETVVKNAFDIIFAFDETISFGYRESVTLAQVKTYLEMESNDEKLAQRIEQAKINEAKEMAKKKAMELDKQRKIDAKNKKPEAIVDSFDASANEQKIGTMDFKAQPQVQMNEGVTYSTGNAMGDEGAAGMPIAYMPKKGMQLGRKKPNAMAEMQNAFNAQQQA